MKTPLPSPETVPQSESGAVIRSSVLLADGLSEIISACEHNIPHYAYGDNEAACEMSHRLKVIGRMADNLRSLQQEIESANDQAQAQPPTATPERKGDNQ